jgi:WD40 repeat protein
MAVIAVSSFVLIVWQWRRAEGKAAAEAAANAAAQRHRALAVQSQAELALDQGLALCDRSEVGLGLLWLARSMALADGVGLHDLDRATRINLADWAEQLVHTLWTNQHHAPVLDLAFSPDGRTLVSVGKDRHINVWNVATGKPVGGPIVIHDLGDSRWIGRVAFPPRDSRTMVTGDIAGHAIFWDLDRGTRAREPLVHPPTHMIWGLAFSPDGRRLATCCDDGRVRWWDVATGRLHGQALRHGNEQGYYTLALSPDGRTLVTGGNDQRVVLWDVATGTPIGPPIVSTSKIHMLAFLRDGRRFVFGTRDGGLVVSEPGNARLTDLPSQGTSVTGLAVSSNGRTFATATDGGVLRLWDTSCLRQTGATCEFVVAVTGLAFHPDGRTLAVGQDDGTLRLVEVPKPKAIGPALQTGGAVHEVVFSRDGTRLLTGSASGAQWWETETGNAIGPRMHCSRYEPGKKVKSADGRRTLDVVDLVEATALAADATIVATAGEVGYEERIRGRAEIWDATTGARLRQTPEQPRPLVGAVFSPDSRSLLTWDVRPESAILWDATTLREGRPVLRSCQDGTARFWDLASDQEIAPTGGLRHGYPVMTTAFSPDETWAVTGCQGGVVCLWNAPARTFSHDMRGNAGEVDAAAFSRDGKTLLTGSHDGTARFWDVESGRQLGPSLRHTDAVLSVAFHPDGRSAATGTKNGIAQRWHVPAAPRRGSASQVQDWVEAQTGLELDLQGSVHPWSAGPPPVVAPEQHPESGARK